MIIPMLKPSVIIGSEEFLPFGSETMILRGNKRSRIRAVQMDNFRGLLGIRKMDRVPNPQMIELCGLA